MLLLLGSTRLPDSPTPFRGTFPDFSLTKTESDRLGIGLETLCFLEISLKQFGS
jgi:hypothetical protein